MESLFKHGSAANVSLSLGEHARLCERFGRRGAAEWIEKLSLWKAAKGKRTKSDYFTVLMWARRDQSDNDDVEAAVDDPTPEMIADKAAAIERQRLRNIANWELDAARHQHDHRCQYGAVCRYVPEKRPR